MRTLVDRFSKIVSVAGFKHQALYISTVAHHARRGTKSDLTHYDAYRKYTECP